MVEEGLTDRFITAEWRIGGGDGRPGGPLIVTESLFLTKPRDCSLADAAITVSPGEEAGTIVLESDRPAFHVTPECDFPGRFDDAGFTLLPGQRRELRFLARGGIAGGQEGAAAAYSPVNITPRDLAAGTRVRHLRGTY
jgi:hypothetical protein